MIRQALAFENSQGPLNYQGAVPDVWIEEENRWHSQGSRFAVAPQMYLPFHLPYNDTWAPGTGDPLNEYGDVFDPNGSGNAGGRTADGDYYYGFLGGPMPPTPPISQQAPLVDDSFYFYGGELPVDMMPTVQEPPPWMRQDLVGLY